MSAAERGAAVETLWRGRPRSRLLRGVVVALALWTVLAWTSPELDLAGFLTERRASNLVEFLRRELVPFSLRGSDWGPTDLLRWVLGAWHRVGAESTGATLQIAVVAMALAALAAAPLALALARNVARREPFSSAPDLANANSTVWRLTRGAARGTAILLRAVPEYILAFLLLAVLGPRTAWPAVLALALHNAGILARLGGEAIENLDPAPLRALTGAGSSRAGLVVFGIAPLTLTRGLLLFFYRFETCVREATVLGMLGVVSLGYWIQDARAKQFYDEVLVLVLFGAGLVLAADLTSAVARYSIRRRG